MQQQQTGPNQAQSQPALRVCQLYKKALMCTFLSTLQNRSCGSSTKLGSVNTKDGGKFAFSFLIMGEGKVIWGGGRGERCCCVFIFLQFKMPEKKITTERLQMGAVYF